MVSGDICIDGNSGFFTFYEDHLLKTGEENIGCANSLENDFCK